MESEPKATRRELLVIGAAVSVLPLCSAACGADTQPQGRFEVGTIPGLPEGGTLSSAEAEVFVGRDAGGLFAFSQICTHVECVVNPPNALGIIECPCHFSHYNRFGEIQPGSLGRRDLTHYVVTVQNGRIIVDTTQTTTTEARTPVS